MASFISRLFSRLGQKNKDARRSRRERSRQLRLEPMESRRLLAGDIATIGGNVYTDLTDNGLDVGDTALVGERVHLYKDGGGATFESGNGVAGGDDTYIGFADTDANGDYLFENLDAGTYFVEQEAVTGLLQRPAETVKTVVISAADANGIAVTTLDNFDTTAQTLQATPGLTTDSSSVATAGGETLGDERDILVNLLAGANNIDVVVNGGLLSINPGAGTSGNVIVTYDGADGDATTIDHGNLNVDLTASNAEAFQFLVGSEAGNTITVDVYSNATDFSTYSVALPTTAGAAATETMILRFADFTTSGGAGADFTSVSAIRIQVDMTAASDTQIDFTQTIAPFLSTQNFANLNPMSIGDYVFEDLNNNGVLDGTEAGLDGVDVDLYMDTNSNGSFDGGDTLVTSTTTVAGDYLFEDLLPGDYIVVVPLSNFATAADALFGYATSTGNDPAPDPDLSVINGDDNGTFVAGVGVVSAAITLASGTEPTTDGDTNPNSDLTLDFGFAPQVDLEVVKTVDAAIVTAGNQVTYTLTITNNGDAASTNVLVVDDLPNFLTIDSATATNGGTVTQTANASGEVEVSYASLDAGQTETITIVATVAAAEAAATGVVNTATISGEGVDTNPTNNTDTANIDINRQAVLAITKSDTPDPNSVGSLLTYTIVVDNNGPSTATNVVISDTLPAGLTFSQVSTTAGTASEASGVITVNVPTLTVGGQVTVTVEATILATFSGSLISNTASAQADEAAVVTASADTTVNPQVDLAITKTDDADPVDRGDQVTYTIVVTNNGPSAATNVEVVDTLPADVSFVSATGGTITAPSGGSSDVIVNVGGLASGESKTVTITVDVLQTAATTFTNNAIVRSTESTGGFDSNTANNSTSETTSTQATIDLAITKTDSVDPVVPGESYVYTLVVTNNGPSDATGVNVVDNLPDGLRITSATSTVGTVTIPATAQDTTLANNDDLTVAIGALASGATATITVNATALPSATGTLSNVATVSSSAAGVIESNSANNTATETTTLTPEIDLAVTKTDSSDPVVAGNALNYTIVVTNNGPSTATNVTLTDTLPAGLNFSSVTSSQGTTSQASGVISGQLGTIDPGASVTITVGTTVDPTTRGTLTNTATVTATETETSTTNNSATATTTVNASIDLAITKADSIDPVAAGGTLTYTMVVTNNGPSDATNVVVTDVLPTGLTFSSGSSTQGSVANAAGTITASVGTLEPGQSATITVITNVATTATGTLTNTATVDGAETDSVSTNNSASVTTSIAVPGSIAGSVYIDVDKNGVKGTGETGISGVTIALNGTDIQGNTVSETTTTDANGDYLFSDLLPGTYTLSQTQPEGFQDGQTNVGTGATGTAGTNQITTITLGSGANATAFNFGELQQSFSKRRFLASTNVNV